MKIKGDIQIWRTFPKPYMKFRKCHIEELLEDVSFK